MSLALLPFCSLHSKASFCSSFSDPSSLLLLLCLSRKRRTRLEGQLTRDDGCVVESEVESGGRLASVEADVGEAEEMSGRTPEQQPIAATSRRQTPAGFLRLHLPQTPNARFSKETNAHSSRLPFSSLLRSLTDADVHDSWLLCGQPNCRKCLAVFHPSQLSNRQDYSDFGFKIPLLLRISGYSAIACEWKTTVVGRGGGSWRETGPRADGRWCSVAERRRRGVGGNLSGTDASARGAPPLVSRH